jgi:cell division protein FtsZ
MQRRQKPPSQARIRVIGVGGGGITAVNHLIMAGVQGPDFVAIDADASALRTSLAPVNLQIGDPFHPANGLAGNRVLGRQEGLRSQETIRHTIAGSDMVFVLAGLGGGAGSGAAPVVAQLARQEEALVMAIVTCPYSFEGQKRADNAAEAVNELRRHTDTLIAIPNDRLLQKADGAIGFHETYRIALDIWHQSIQGISNLVNRPGLINVDFADVRSIMSGSGAAVITTSRGWGADRARQAAFGATRSDLLGITVDGARAMLFNVVGGANLSLDEVKTAAAIITGRAHPEANVIFGAEVDGALGDEMHITLVATGFGIEETHLPGKQGQEVSSARGLERRALARRRHLSPVGRTG